MEGLVLRFRRRAEENCRKPEDSRCFGQSPNQEPPNTSFERYDGASRCMAVVGSPWIKSVLN
jgi:hypothetical protein